MSGLRFVKQGSYFRVTIRKELFGTKLAELKTIIDEDGEATITLYEGKHKVVIVNTKNKGFMDILYTFTKKQTYLNKGELTKIFAMFMIYCGLENKLGGNV